MLNPPQLQQGPVSPEERRALYRVIFSRRDVRGQFIDTPVDEAVLSRILYAAHHAPSVGFMQPWNFILVKSRAVRERVHAAFTKAHAEAAEMFPKEKRQTYRKLKLEGIRGKSNGRKTQSCASRRSRDLQPPVAACGDVP